VQALAFDASGSRLAAADLHRLVIWTPGGERSAVVPLGAQAWSVAVSRDGARAATGLDDGRVLVVDAGSGRVEHTLHPLRAPNVSVAFAQDGTLLTGSYQGIVQRWNPRTGAEIDSPIRVAPGPVAAIAFNPGGNLFATSSLTEGNVRLWRLNLQQFGGTFPGPAFALTNTSFTADGRGLIVVFDDGTGVIWPVSLASWTAHACAVAGRDLTRDEWGQFLPGHRYQATCSHR
jgi:WD40 repeat protein